MKARKSISITAVIALGVPLALPLNVSAADATDRTRMPDICSNRDVTCVLPDGAGAQRPTTGGTAATNRSGSISGDSTVVVTPPLPSATSPGTLPSLGNTTPNSGNTVPSLGNTVPSQGNTVPSLGNTVPSSPGTTSTTGPGGGPGGQGTGSGATGSGSGGLRGGGGAGTR